eukprot:TRINITY_DN664_c0_g1_i1.p1 TRINITY_DN664_c0_g1~~TRINITY_DN664_c0_g1_i1.p1  ORF type:complete len:237 (+),score=49.82 TRINITY_DN664_c0_g1_i1:358-1068(+)
MFTISPPTTNVGIITVTPTGTNVVLPLTSGVTLDDAVAATGGLICCNTIGSDASKPCCNSDVTLSKGIVAAGAELAKSTRKYTTANILLITFGGFTDTLSQVTTALTSAQVSINKILNLFVVAVGRDNTLLVRMNAIKSQNDVLNFNLQTDVNLYKVYNRVISRGDSLSLNTNIEEVTSAICGGNGDASCGLHCCGDCTCGTVCVPPVRCRLSNCFNVTLTPSPRDRTRSRMPSSA